MSINGLLIRSRCVYCLYVQKIRFTAWQKEVWTHIKTKLVGIAKREREREGILNHKIVPKAGYKHSRIRADYWYLQKIKILTKYDLIETGLTSLEEMRKNNTIYFCKQPRIFISLKMIHKLSYVTTHKVTQAQALWKCTYVKTEQLVV